MVGEIADQTVEVPSGVQCYHVGLMYQARVMVCVRRSRKNQCIKMGVGSAVYSACVKVGKVSSLSERKTFSEGGGEVTNVLR